MSAEERQPAPNVWETLRGEGPLETDAAMIALFQERATARALACSLLTADSESERLYDVASAAERRLRHAPCRSITGAVVKLILIEEGFDASAHVDDERLMRQVIVFLLEAR